MDFPTHSAVCLRNAISFRSRGCRIQPSQAVASTSNYPYAQGTKSQGIVPKPGAPNTTKSVKSNQKILTPAKAPVRVQPSTLN
ncbi:hypothetical protein M407DRAFT_28707 [Tulasnella calospora MUT 4182]|uniref:Uncharacterized protein n=1 Tax=Tulasnella calospora MUT 4182 TaxID=1051891 RepID=A0A0C3QBG7_9AGAM|nr:hypothetical protein M407DRAFT_28707 [Tulasnella calospora MUT 4182]